MYPLRSVTSLANSFHARRRRSAFLGWRMLWIAGLVVFAAAAGQTYSVSAFVDPVIADLGISRSLLSTAYALGTFTGGIVVLLVGRQLDRWGSRRVMALAAVGLAVGLTVLSLAAGPLWLFLGFPLIRTFGQGLMPLAARVLIPNWFYRLRGRAFSLLGLAVTISIAVVPLVNTWLIDAVGWRTAWRVASVLLLIVLIPIVVRFVIDRPEDIGQMPDGATAESDGAVPANDAGIGLSLADAKRTLTFWGLVTAGAVQPLVMTELHLHQAAIFVDRGASHAVATATFSIEAVSMLGVTIAVGWLNDRFPVRNMLGAGLIMLALTLLALLFSGNLVIAVLYAVLRGASGGLINISIDIAWPSYYGRKHLGSIRGFGMAAGLFGSAIGPLPFGIAADVFGGYTPAILTLLVLPILAAVLVLGTKPPVLVQLPVTVARL